MVEEAGGSWVYLIVRQPLLLNMTNIIITIVNITRRTNQIIITLYARGVTATHLLLFRRLGRLFIF